MRFHFLYIAALTTCCFTQCNKRPKPHSDEGSPKNVYTTRHPASVAQRSLTLYSWDEYFSPEVLSDFTKITGIGVEIRTFEDTDEVEPQVQSEPGKHDVIVFDGDKVDKFREQQMLYPLDHSKLPNFQNLEKKHTNFDKDPGNQYSVPYLWGTTLIAYRKDKIPSPERSWKLLWDPALKGHIGMLSERLETLGAALLMNGYSINDRTDPALASAQQSLLTQAKELDAQLIEGVPSALNEGLSSGELWAAMAYSGDAAMVAQENDNIGYFIPEEGCTMWMDHFVITRDTSRSEEAHEFLDFMLTGPAAAKNANYLRYATPRVCLKTG